MQKAILALVFLAITAFLGEKLPIKTGAGTTGAPVVPAPVVPRPSHAQEEQAVVTRVVDGDTIVVDINGIEEKIRLIGVDTPETVDPRKPVQCFGKEASAFTKNLLEGRSVKLESDPSQGDRDKYGRLLRYVFLSDGTLVNKEIIAQGYGHEYTYRTPYKYQADFKAAEHSARKNHHGLWAPGVCG